MASRFDCLLISYDYLILTFQRIKIHKDPGKTSLSRMNLKQQLKILYETASLTNKVLTNDPAFYMSPWMQKTSVKCRICNEETGSGRCPSLFNGS